MPRDVVVLLAFVLVAGCSAPVPAATELTQAGALVWAAPYDTLVIRIDYIEGRSPSPLAIEAMVEALRDVTDKRVLTVDGPHLIRGVVGDPTRSWGREDFDDFHAGIFDVAFHDWQANGSAYLHVVYLDGHSSDASLLGLNRGAEILIYADNIRNEGSVRPTWADLLERSVLVHETGHALGLVNCGVPMLTARQEDGCHSNNEESVMYSTADNSLMAAVLEARGDGTGIHYRFDANDLADLAAYRESGRAAP